MLLPRFTIRTLFVMLTACAVVAVVIGTAFRGQNWAWGVSIAVASLGLTAIVHAAWSGLVSVIAQLAPAKSLPGRTAYDDSSAMHERGHLQESK
jgi:hypothetical protein